MTLQMMLNIESTLHYLRMKVLNKLTYLVFLYILYSVFHEAWENEWSCFGGRFCCMFSVLPAFYSEFYFSLTSQQPVICVTSAFKETTLELSHLSLNGPTELCCTPPLPPPPSQEMRLISLCPAIHASGLELLLSAGDFHWDSGQYSRRHTERLSGPRAADWMKGRSNTVCKASPDCCPALSVCVCVCLLGRIVA